MKAHVARVDITPEQGQDLCGFAARFHGKTTGVHDRLFSKWLFLNDGKTRLLLSSNDIIGFTRSFCEKMQKDVSQATGIPRSHIIIAASHTHSGPASMPVKECGDMDPAYMKSLYRKMVETAIEATRGSVEVKIGAGLGSVKVNRNRRKGDAGSVDSQLGVIVFKESKSGKMLSVICNYACHAVVMGEGNFQVSADFPGVLQKRVEKATGAQCHFFNGACGDINPVIAHSVDFNHIEEVGGEIADEALNIMKNLEWLEDDSISCTKKYFNLPLYAPRRPSEIDQAFDFILKAYQPTPRHFLKRMEVLKRKIREGSYPRKTEISATLVTLGNKVAFLVLPGEVLVDIGVNIKKMSPFPYTLIIGYGNGNVGYIPTKDAFKEGGYEPYQAPVYYGYCGFDPSVEDVLMENLSPLLSRS
ncbi:neutral/alkaline non-lysosomal ceramidase N-terminal domain-containing protein [Candidatus Sumerlaeota bacterium]|nr:neutral/alkaline non-lysosomal ceramidase N-terminal domain-containing protein [Candidatus Sumerlaeota bacterium]